MKILSSTSMVLLLIISAYHFELLWIFGASRKSPCLSHFLHLPHSPSFTRSIYLFLTFFFHIASLSRLRNFSQEEFVVPFWMNANRFFLFLLVSSSYFWFGFVIHYVYPRVCECVRIKTLLRKWASGQLVVRNLAQFCFKRKMVLDTL